MPTIGTALVSAHSTGSLKAVDYVVKKVNVNKVTETVMGVRGQIECDNYAFRETIIDWTIVADDALTEFEQSQLAYEGKIRYGSKEITW